MCVGTETTDGRGHAMDDFKEFFTDVDEDDSFYVHTDAAAQKTEHDAVYLIGTVTHNFDCIPCEGTPDESISFRNADGFGYTMSYTTNYTDCSTSQISDVHIERDPRFDDSTPMTPDELLEDINYAILWTFGGVEGDVVPVHMCEDIDEAESKLSELLSDCPAETYRIVRVAHTKRA